MEWTTNSAGIGVFSGKSSQSVFFLPRNMSHDLQLGTDIKTQRMCFFTIIFNDILYSKTNVCKNFRNIYIYILTTLLYLFFKRFFWSFRNQHYDGNFHHPFYINTLGYFVHEGRNINITNFTAPEKQSDNKDLFNYAED